MPERSCVGEEEEAGPPPSVRRSSVGGGPLLEAAVVIAQQLHVVRVQTAVGCCSATWDAAHSGPDVVGLRLGLRRRVFWQGEAAALPWRHRLMENMKM